MRIAVTGASGFVGRHLVPKLKEQGHTVLEYNSNNFDSIFNLRSIDYIIHLAVNQMPSSEQ